MMEVMMHRAWQTAMEEKEQLTRAANAPAIQWVEMKLESVDNNLFGKHPAWRYPVGVLLGLWIAPRL
jgi:hypothetical protein